MVHMFDPFV